MAIFKGSHLLQTIISGIPYQIVVDPLSSFKQDVLQIQIAKVMTV